MDARSLTNRLADETSPYLQQHAANPVAWQPWDEQALAAAREQDKPILLSIGYSACHWCHVMAHESFEDEATARVMNERFVNIKVDREERPDLDKIYQTAHQLLVKRGGGWPLTMFLTPDQVPFFGGTYFPKEPRYGMPAFKDLLRNVADFYRQHRGEIGEQNASLVNALSALNGKRGAYGDSLNAAPLDGARRQLAQQYDARDGGFGDAPKFPHATSIERLLRHWGATAGGPEPDETALVMATHTLRRMAEGGIYDHLGGGFCRYSVDGEWTIPHFEKMLYDNGPLLALYAQAWRATGDPLFRQVAEETADWAVREMQSPEGGFYSTLDADSEGEEGKFYVWDAEAVRHVLSERQYAVFARRYGLDGPPNFEGRWHLRVGASLEQVAEEAAMDRDEVEALLESARTTLFDRRAERVPPGRDEKILTAWNGLMIKGMAVAGNQLQRDDYLDSAGRALDFVRQHLWRDGRLLATYKDGRARHPAYLDDHAFLLDGALALLEARWRSDELAFARQLADLLLEHFEDGENGGFYFTADDAERLIQRPKSLADDAIPSGAGVAAYALQRLGHLVGDHTYVEAAERALRNAWPALSEMPYAHNAMLLALEEYLYPPETVVIRGPAEAMAPWQRFCIEAYAPRRWVLAVPADARDLPGELAERKADSGDVVAYVCQGTTCQPPMTDLDALGEALSAPQT